jgi:cysteine-rich repeat protein
MGNNEECDDGNTNDGDGCSANCQLEQLGGDCGDNNVDNLEVCDDGNTANGDNCNPTCNLANDVTLYVGSPGNTGNQDGQGNQARIGGFGTLTVDNQYLYLGDSGNRIIRRIDVNSAQVTTIAGNGNNGDSDNANGLQASFGEVGSIATDGSKLWFTSNRKIKEVDLSGNFPVTTVAGSGAQGIVDGVGGNAEFDDQRGLTYYNGLLYTVDGNGAVLRSFNPQNNEVLTLAGLAYQTGVQDGVGANARFISPRYMTSDNSGMLYVADTNGYHIRAFNVATDEVTTFAGSGQQGYADGVGANASIHRPRGMASDGTSIYFVEFNQHTVRQGIIATQDVSTLAGQHCNGNANCNGNYSNGIGTAAQFDGPFSMAFHFPSNSLFVVDSANAVIRRIQ